MRRLMMAVTILLMALPVPAFGGGSWIEPYRDSYQAGDTVTMRGSVSAGQLGWVEDGPFYAYLRVDRTKVNQFCVGDWPCILDTDIPLGELKLTVNTTTKHLDVTITFTLPDDLADGEYEVVYCNDPCSEGLGDLIGGYIYVGITAEKFYEATLTTTATSTTVQSTSTSLQITAAGPIPDRTAVSDPAPYDPFPTLGMIVGGLAVAGLAVSAARRRRA